MTNKQKLFSAIKSLPHPEHVKKSLRGDIRKQKSAWGLSDNEAIHALERLHKVANLRYAYAKLPKHLKRVQGEVLRLDRHLYSPEQNKLHFKNGSFVKVSCERYLHKAIETVALERAINEVLELLQYKQKELIQL